MELSDAPEKNPQWPGIDPGTLRLVAQWQVQAEQAYLKLGDAFAHFPNSFFPQRPVISSYEIWRLNIA
jgi:hypothetical protein